MLIVPIGLIVLFIVYTNGGVEPALEKLDAGLRGFFATVGDSLARVVR